MIVHTMTLGVFGVNNFLLHPENSSKAILIDACEDYPSILKKLDELKLELYYLINTHGHGDHIAGNAAIIQATGAQLLIHAIEVPYLNDPRLNLSGMIDMPLQSPEPDRLLNEGDSVALDELKLTVVHTPGHTPGHISLVGDGIAFVGDVIFKESIGRTDFPGGSYDQLLDTIRRKIYTLPDNTILYNGHTESTSVAHEKRYNPFVRADE